MQMVKFEIVDKAEDFPCYEVEMVKAFVVKGGMQSGLPSVILRFTDGTNWFEADVSGQIISVIGQATQELINQAQKGDLQ